ncbi:MAG: rod shape-determining protein MreC [Candidatus Binatia bacterium]
MLAFVRKNQILLASFLCVLLSLYILTAAARGRLRSDPVGPLLLWFLRPLQIAAQVTIASIQEVQEGFATVASYKLDNEKLKKRILEIEAEKNRLLEAEATNRRLRQLLEFRSNLPARSITASIVANSASTWFQSCLLDKGTADGIRKGMAVVTPLGVVGRVIAVTGRSSKVLLVTDPNSGVDVLVQRTRARGIVSGSLGNGTVMKYVKQSEDVQEGDRLVTSGLDGAFPKGLMVGIVTKVSKQHLGLFQFIEVTPAVNFSKAEEVLVVSSDGGP